METRNFILFRNEEYACSIAKKLNGHIRKSESEILSIRPIKGDVFFIDAHFGGQMSDLIGLDIVNNLLKFRQGDEFEIKVFSWLSIEDISHLHPEKINLLNKQRIQFFRYPVII